MDKTFVLDDISHYVTLFRRFGIDVEGAAPGWNQQHQIELEELDMLIERELQADKDHQLTEWIINDRAYEAIGLIEADGPGIGLNGKISREYAKRSRKNGPFISLVRTNRDRIVAKLESAPITIDAVPTTEKDLGAVGNINKLKEKILSENNFDYQLHSVIEDAVSYGSGTMMIDFGAAKDSPDVNRLLELGETRGLSMEQFYHLQHAISSHKISYVPTFEFIRCRHAHGSASANYNDPSHRWLHWIQQATIAEVRKKYPNIEGQLGPSISDVYADMNPVAGRIPDIQDSVTKKTTWIRFPIVDSRTIYLNDPEGNGIPFPVTVERHAVARVTRIEGVGVVDIEIDEFNHNRIPVAAFVYFPSTRHSCGIGSVKFGRDAQVIHNKLHKAMLRMFDTMSKGGGFVDSRLGLTPEQIQKRSEEGTYHVVKMPDHLQGKSLREMIVDTSMSTFPSSYPELLHFHSTSVDETMNVPNAAKGFQQGTSGRQELILQQQAEIVHSVVISQLERAVREMAVMLYTNITQFNDKPFVFYFYDPVTKKQERVEMNMPEGFYPFFNEETGEIDLRPFGIVNDITSVMFQIKVTTDSIVPKEPNARANFFFTLFGNTVELIRDPEARVYLRLMNQKGMHIPEIEEACALIDKMQADAQKQMADQQQRLEQQQKEQMDREYGLKAAELAQSQQKLEIDALTKMPGTEQPAQT